MSVIPGKIKGKARPRLGRFGTYTPPGTVEYENLVRMLYMEQGGMFYSKPVRVEICAYFAVPKSAGKRRRAGMLCGDERPAKKPDADNIAKIICDALNGIAYQDDAAVAELSVVKKWDDTERIELAVSEVE